MDDTPLRFSEYFQEDFLSVLEFSVAVRSSLGHFMVNLGANRLLK